MPRPKKPGGPEPKKRSRNGCWPCKTKKVKCGEERPTCLNCGKQGETCDYSIRLNWEGRTKRKAGDHTPEPISTTKPECYSPPQFQKHGSESMETSQYTFASSDLTQREAPHDHSIRNIQADGEFGRGTGDTSQHGSLHAPLEIMAPKVWQASSPWDTTRDELSASQLSRLRESTNSTSPSMIGSILDNASTQGTTPSSFVPHSHIGSQTAMPPPMIPEAYAGVSLDYFEFSQPQLKAKEPTTEHPSKRRRYDPPSKAGTDDPGEEHVTYSSPGLQGTIRRQTSTSSQSSTHTQGHSRYSSIDANIGLNTPPLSTIALVGPSNQPAHSSRSSAQYLPSVVTATHDPRRLSVNSLLSSPTRLEFDNQVTSYGVDKGFPDLDTPLNDDSHALDRATPISSTRLLTDQTGGNDNGLLTEFGFGLYGNDSTPSNGEYYANPVLVEIAKSLEPLPQVLTINPMNILYFHHFLNHTAKILVPHDCPENPFRVILPQMAVRDTHLMHLLLAYSASHRARLLKHAEPSNRISVWVKDVFPSLRHSLSEPTGKISDTCLATAIMLASLEIIAPATFGVDIPWHQHLDTARQIILARGDLPPVQHDKVAQFLYRWFAYLDVLGSLSGAKTTRVLSPPSYASPLPTVDKDSGQVDCMLGFTSRCVTILAKIAELARLCDSVRIDPTGNVREDWRPTEQIVESAEYLQYHLRAARKQPYKFCPHRRITPGSDDDLDMQEMMATNDAFHWAGLIHLYRRVLGKQSDDEDVQEAVRQILHALLKVRKGGTAEACLLFPMFTAGCDAKDSEQRMTILERVRSVEGSGMTQVHKARKLMERVWDTGKPWETLVQGEFFG